MSFQINNRDFHKLMTLLMEVRNNQGLILSNQEKMMATLDEVLADVAEESTTLDSLSVFVKGLQQQIKDALAGVTLPTAVQAKVDAVFAGVEANKAKAVKAMEANVE